MKMPGHEHLGWALPVPPTHPLTPAGQRTVRKMSARLVPPSAEASLGITQSIRRPLKEQHGALTRQKSASLNSPVGTSPASHSPSACAEG